MWRTFVVAPLAGLVVLAGAVAPVVADTDDVIDPAYASISGIVPGSELCYGRTPALPGPYPLSVRPTADPWAQWTIEHTMTAPDAPPASSPTLGLGVVGRDDPLETLIWDAWIDSEGRGTAAASECVIDTRQADATLTAGPWRNAITGTRMWNALAKDAMRADSGWTEPRRTTLLGSEHLDDSPFTYIDVLMRVGPAAYPGDSFAMTSARTESWVLSSRNGLDPMTPLGSVALPAAPEVPSPVIDDTATGLIVRAWHLPTGGENVLTIRDAHGVVIGQQVAPNRPSSDVVIDGVSTLSRTLMGSSEVPFAQAPTTDTIYVTQTVNGYESAPTEVRLSRLFGGRLDGLVYDDHDGDGRRDAGEAPLAGIEVTVSGRDVFQHEVSFDVTTDAAGAFGADLLAGTYNAEPRPVDDLDVTERAIGLVVESNQVAEAELGLHDGDVVPAPPVDPVDPVVETPQPEKETSLARTGIDGSRLAIVSAASALLVAVGAGAVIAAARRRRSSHPS